LEAKPKYRCPGCDLSTCSLVCSRRHKTRTECSGTRDAFAYKRKVDLKDATKDELARDYRFLENIERTIAITTDDTNNESGSGGSTNPNRSNNNHVALQQALRKSNVTVIKAPKGIKRALENQTTFCGYVVFLDIKNELDNDGANIKSFFWS